MGNSTRHFHLHGQNNSCCKGGERLTLDTQKLKEISVSSADGDFQANISFSHIEKDFNDKNRNLVLYSNIEYTTDSFKWEATVPTVIIPYKDPALGFLVDGVIKSSVGIYQRAPGVVFGKEPDSEPDFDDRLDIVTSRNSTIGICYKRNGIVVEFHKGPRKRYIPLGVFLKAISGLPYRVLLDRFVPCTPAIRNSFPCEVPQRSVDLAKEAHYSASCPEEPSVDDCVAAVYNAILHHTQSAGAGKTHYSVHWKLNRINAYLAGLHFKNELNYEGTLALHARAINTYLDEDLCIDIFDDNWQPQQIIYPRGTFITEQIASQLRWYNVRQLRVKAKRQYVISEDTPMLFRAVGYKLAQGIPSLSLSAGDVLTQDTVKRLNKSNVHSLDVITPTGRTTLMRSGEHPELGDFYTMVNALVTSGYYVHSDTSQYEIANRVVVDYEKQVLLEVEQTYQDIAGSLLGCTELSQVTGCLPKRPNDALIKHLGEASNKELNGAELTNVMARAISERRASALMKATPAAMTAVQPDQYGRIDSLHSPESDKVGSVQEVTAMAKIDTESGQLLAPYEKVVDGKPTGEIEYISAAKERNKYIVGWDNDLSESTVMARCNGDVTTVSREQVSYRDASAFCDMSVSRMTIPFPEFSQPRRSLMATKMSGQAVPLLFPERPRVSTGADMEVPCLYYTGRQIVEAGLGEERARTATGELHIISVAWVKAGANYTCAFEGESFVFFVPFCPTDKKTLYNYRLNYKEGDVYGMDDIVFYNQSCDIGEHEYFERIKQGTLPLIQGVGRPSLALGVNLTVAYKTYGSSTVDDAVVISDRLIANRKLSSVQVFKYEYSTKPNESIAQIDGVPALHSHVSEGESVITILRVKGEGGSKVSVKHVFADMPGEVIYTEISAGANRSQTAVVLVSCIHDAAVGDKVAGRHGNKSVIAKIVPADSMPYDPQTGSSVDIICSPLGIPSRVNLGQIIEVTLGAAMSAQDKYAVVTPFYPGIKEDVKAEYESCGLAKKRLFNPIYGKFTEREVLVGTMYFLKLEQMSNLKHSAVGLPVAVDPVYGQPIRSINSDKGQAIGEMETWALTAAGADKVLDGLFTIGASDEKARDNYFGMLEKNTEHSWEEDYTPYLSRDTVNRDSLVTQTILRMFGLELQPSDSHSNRYEILPLNMDDIVVECAALALKNHNETVAEHVWQKVLLPNPVVNPFWVENFPLHKVLGVKSVRALANKTYWVNVHNKAMKPASKLEEFERSAYVTGVPAIISLLQTTTLDQAIQFVLTESETLPADGVAEESTVVLDEELASQFDELGVGVPEGSGALISFLQRMKAAGLELRDLVWHHLPILPRVFRQSSLAKGSERDHSFHKQLLSMCVLADQDTLYRALRDFIGYGTANDKGLISLRGYFFGKGASSGQHGTVRGNVLSKRVAFSGRSVIVPSSDPEMSPFCVGIPWKLAMIELGEILAMRLRQRSGRMSAELFESIQLPQACLSTLKQGDWLQIVHSLHSYNDYVFGNLFPGLDVDDRVALHNYFRREVRQICEGNTRNDGYVKVKGEWVAVEDVPEGVTIDAVVVCLGRQPTLHPKSIRCFFGRLVDGYAMRLHPVVCAGFNADFDGDTMWNAQMLGPMKQDAWGHLSVLQQLISEKDGSYTLSLAQDVALGLYCASIFKNNSSTWTGSTGAYYYFDNPKKLRHQLEFGDLSYYDAVLYYDSDSGRYYCSTAGRVLLNSVIPGAFTAIPFTAQPNCVAPAVLPENACASLHAMRYDEVWVATGIRPEGRPGGVKIEDVLLEVYRVCGARPSVLVTQDLYEIGLTASDLYSVTMSIDDMEVDTSLEEFMSAPKKYVSQLNTLQQMGLITENSRRTSANRAWERARKDAMKAVLRAIDPDSNTHFLMYSGARGKPEQVMQSVGFIGTISKTTSTDIEYPILRSYGSGLSSLDLAQTCYTARIGVVSTQAGTKDTGYATRQTVYMSSGMTVKEDDCGLEFRAEPVVYDSDNPHFVDAAGVSHPISDLVGELIDPSRDLPDNVLRAVSLSGFVVNNRVLDIIVSEKLDVVPLLGSDVHITYGLNESWKFRVLEEGYSYALPYTDGGKITEKSLEWVISHNLSEIILFDAQAWEDRTCFNKEAYLPVDYDTSKFSIYMDGRAVGVETLYGREVDPKSPSFYLYSELLEGEKMSLKALNYLTKKRVREVKFADGRTAIITFKLSGLFRELVLGRVSTALPHLDSDKAITAETLNEIERVQLDCIPVRSSLTCLTRAGVCKVCHGKSLSTKKFVEVGSNIGIPAAQAQCEPLSQATLNVTHSGGKRGAGIGLVSGLAYYMQLLKGKVVSEKDSGMLESFAPVSGIARRLSFDKHHYQIQDALGNTLSAGVLSDPERFNVPDGAFVECGDTLIAGLPRLDRYSSRDIFDSALRTRYLLLKEYYKIFAGLNVSPRNYEVLAREQTSICYREKAISGPLTKDTAQESLDDTGAYRLTLSKQYEVVNKYSGVAGFAFENVARMLLSWTLEQDGLPLNSTLGNLVTGTEVGSRVASFIPKTPGNIGVSGKLYRKSAVKSAQEELARLKAAATARMADGVGLGSSDAKALEEAKYAPTDDLLFQLNAMADQLMVDGDFDVPKLELPSEPPMLEVEVIGADSDDTVETVDPLDVLEVEYVEVVDTSSPTEDDRHQPGSIGKIILD